MLAPGVGGGSGRESNPRLGEWESGWESTRGLHAALT